MSAPRIARSTSSRPLRRPEEPHPFVAEDLQEVLDVLGRYLLVQL